MVTIEMKNVAAQNVVSFASPSTLLKKAGSYITNSRFAIALASLLSFMLGEEISSTKAMHFLSGFSAAICAFLFGGISIMVQLLMLAWLVIAVCQYRKSL